MLAGMALAVGLVFAGEWATSAQTTNAIDWFTISGGGGTSTGGVYSLTSVIGQPAPANLTGGNYQLQGGFLSYVGLVQTIGAPKLALVLTNGNTLFLSWPVPADGFVLEKSATVNAPANQWQAIGSGYQTNATQISVTLPLLPGNQFYRLKK